MERVATRGVGRVRCLVPRAAVQAGGFGPASVESPWVRTALLSLWSLLSRPARPIPPFVHPPCCLFTGIDQAGLPEDGAEIRSDMGTGSMHQETETSTRLKGRFRRLCRR